MIINGLVFLATAVPTTGHLLTVLFALWPFGAEGFTYGTARMETLGFMPWQLVTYSFLHDGLGHLFFNMFALWMFGMELENAWGSYRFALFYFICVVGAGVTHLVATLGGIPVPTVGASGGVFGVLLAFGMLFPDRSIFLFPFPFPIKARIYVIGYGLVSLFSGMSNVADGIAHFAHLGGMVFGYFLIRFWKRTNQI